MFQNKLFEFLYEYKYSNYRRNNLADYKCKKMNTQIINYGKNFK